MAYKIVFKSKALKQLEALPRKAQEALGEKIDELETSATPGGCEKLKGNLGLWRIRAGNYRAIYQAPDSDGVIRVLKVGHRGSVYDQFS